MARDKRLAQQRELADSLRNRVAGKYASGAISEKMEAARAAEEAQAQMGPFGASELPAAADDAAERAPERPIELGERYTIGHAAERQIAGMMPMVGANFQAGKPVKLWRPDMSGKYVGRRPR